MFDTNVLVTALLFSSFGMGYFIYGKKNHRSIPLICGTTLMIYPYFITNPLYSSCIGIFLMIIPFFIKMDF